MSEITLINITNIFVPYFVAQFLVYEQKERKIEQSSFSLCSQLLERQFVDLEKLNNLRFVSDVSEIVPISVIRTPENKYRVVNGYHRLTTAYMKGFNEIPCHILNPEYVPPPPRLNLDTDDKWEKIAADMEKRRKLSYDDGTPTSRPKLQLKKRSDSTV
jgi:hypothetical protein